MPRKGFLDPKTFVESSGGSFKEGNILIDRACFRVHHADVKVGQTDRGAYTALVWGVTRLDDDLQPMTDPATDEPLTEEVIFGAGGKSLAQIHPGQGSTPEDEDIEDQTDKDGAEGNTLFFVNEDFALNNKSSLGLLMMSLGSGKEKTAGGDGFKGQHYTAELMTRIWAEDWVGHIFHVKSWGDPDNKMKGNDGVERPIQYKIVGAILKTPGEKAGVVGKGKGKGKGAAAPETTAAAAGKANGAVKATNGNGKLSEEVETAVALVLNRVSEEAPSGESISRKVLHQKCSAMMDTLKIDAKLKLPVMTDCYKNKDWMRDNAQRFGMIIDDDKQIVTFE